MVIGEVFDYGARSREADQDSGNYAVIGAVIKGQRAVVRRSYNGFVEEAGTIESDQRSGLTFIPDADKAGDLGKPWIIVDSKSLEAGEIRATVQTESADGEPVWRPVGTDRQIEIARQLNVVLPQVIQRGEQGILIKMNEARDQLFIPGLENFGTTAATGPKTLEDDVVVSLQPYNQPQLPGLIAA